MAVRRTRLRWAWIVVVLFTASGLLHVVRPSAFDAQVPDFLPLRTAVVVVSGIAELGCAAAMVCPRTRRYGALAAAALLVVVFPGNLWQAYDTWTDAGSSGGERAAVLVRLPLQLPLIWWCWRAARLPEDETPTGA